MPSSQVERVRPLKGRYSDIIKRISAVRYARIARAEPTVWGDKSIQGDLEQTLTQGC